jgi:proline iminopeptidase
VLAAFVAIIACAPKETPRPDSNASVAATLPAGEAMLAVPGGRIWYKKSGTGTATPAILIHGGPGFNSFYLKSLEPIGSDRPVVRYDQLGAGKSDRATDTTLFTVEHFVAELDSLRAALGYDRVHLVGHSWGTMLAHSYYRAHPERVASIVFASPCLDAAAWQRDARNLIATLSDSAKRAIETREAEKNYTAPDYQAAIAEFYGKYVWRHPPAADFDSTMKTYSEAIYGYMWGPSEFTATGTLKAFDSTPYLKDVRVPALFTVGEFDEANPATVKRFASMTKGARYEVIPGAAHMTTWDNPSAMLRVVQGFLRSADSAAAKR